MNVVSIMKWYVPGKVAGSERGKLKGGNVHQNYVRFVEMSKILTFYRNHKITVQDTGLITITRFGLVDKVFEFKTRLNFRDGLNWARRWVREAAY
jgi:hypothetical protein